MFERFSAEARTAVTGAQEQAGRLGHQRIRAGHLLLALMEDDAGAAAGALRSAGADPGPLRRGVEQVLGAVDARRGGSRGLLGRLVPGHIPFGGDAKSALEEALRAASHGGRGRIEAGHLLLGVLAVEAGTGVRALEEAGVGLSAVRSAARSAADGS